MFKVKIKDVDGQTNLSLLVASCSSILDISITNSPSSNLKIGLILFEWNKLKYFTGVNTRSSFIIENKSPNFEVILNSVPKH
jgi:hypothetical protein